MPSDSSGKVNVLRVGTGTGTERIDFCGNGVVPLLPQGKGTVHGEHVGNGSVPRERSGIAFRARKGPGT